MTIALPFGMSNGTPSNGPPPLSRWSLSWSSLSWADGYDGNGSRTSMKSAMMVTMAMTPIANFIMNHTSCVTTFLKIRSAPLFDRGPILILRYHPKRGRSGFIYRRMWRRRHTDCTNCFARQIKELCGGVRSPSKIKPL